MFGDPSGSLPPLVIVIDGPAGAGKSTIAQYLALHYGLPLLDTGAIYRALAWVAKQQGIGWDEEERLAALASHLPIAFHPSRSKHEQQRVFWQDQDISQEIRSEEISQGASKVSALAGVRTQLLALQRQLAARGCVAEGRDMGTVVFPHTGHKFFLTASLDIRAKRRFEQLKLTHPEQAHEPSFTIDQIKREIQHRDDRDSSRAAAPLQQAQDAKLVDSTHLTVEEVVSRIIAIVEQGRNAEANG